MSEYIIEISENQPYYVEVENSNVQDVVNLTVTKDNDVTVEVSTLNNFITFDLPSGYPLSATSGNLEYTRVSGLESYIQSFISKNTTIAIKIYNNSGFSIQKGQAVYIDGFHNASGVPTASVYIANGTISEQLFGGLISDYTSDQDYGYITNFGILSGINTTGSISNISSGNESWSIGDTLYASPLDYGKLTTIKPEKNIILIGIVTKSHATEGSILVRSFINPQFNQLNGIRIESLSDSNIIKYNSSTSQWSNSNFLDGGIV